MDRPRTAVTSAMGALLAVLLGAIAGLQPVVAEELNHAGLVIRHGDGRMTYAYVAFPEETISGVELLRRSGLPHVTLSFGALGEAVCSIGDEGCPASECRQRVCQGRGEDAPFWQYLRQAEPGDWRPLALGASATTVRDGDVDGWSWTGGDPGLPALTIADVAERAGAAESMAATGAGEVPAAAVRDVYPPGVERRAGRVRQSAVTYAAATAMIVLIGAAALYASRRGRSRTGRAPT